MTPPDSESNSRWRRPWRIALLGWLTAAAALAAGVPLFLCMPPWNDVTLHDMAARSVLRGGVHYRDVFDTNLPGIDWAMALVRLLFGWSYEVLRAADLVVVGAAVAVLCGFVRRSGGTGAAVAWFVAAVALFYPFTSEFNHVQRDVWMFLPAVAAAWLRFKQIARWTSPQTMPLNGPSPQLESALTPLFHRAVLEGFVWGLAVWVKPHIVIPALAVWGVSAVLLARQLLRRGVLLDLAGLLLGGVLAGAPGVLWLVGTGAWPYFLDIFLNWNPDYLSEAGSVGERFGYSFWLFRPWSILHNPALALAVLALWESRVWSRQPGGPKPVRVWGLYLPADGAHTAAARALLAALYLGWFTQAAVLQKGFDYVHVPLHFLAMAVVAGQRWCYTPVFVLWFVVVGVLLNWGAADPRVARVARALNPGLTHLQFENHPLADPNVVRYWPRTWTEGSSPELRDRLGQYIDVHCGTNWEELNEVAAYLRSVDDPPGHGELNCWHDSTHPLYLMLDLDPATRYMHYGTAFGIRSKREIIAEEVRASRQRYVVSDLMRTTWHKEKVYGPHGRPVGDSLLPGWLPAAERKKFPWNQPAVYRSRGGTGRYVVHRIEPNIPLGVIRVADWDKLDRLHLLGPDD